jgi:hypothetical protein
MSKEIRFQPEPVRTVAFGGISGVYAGVGAEMTRPIRMMIMQNLTDVLVMFSFDGINDFIPLPTNGYAALDITTNKTVDAGFFLAEGQRLYVKDMGLPATLGAVYLSTVYGGE